MQIKLKPMWEEIKFNSINKLTKTEFTKIKKNLMQFKLCFYQAVDKALLCYYGVLFAFFGYIIILNIFYLMYYIEYLAHV